MGGGGDKEGKRRNAPGEKISRRKSENEEKHNRSTGEVSEGNHYRGKQEKGQYVRRERQTKRRGDSGLGLGSRQVLCRRDR